MGLPVRVCGADQRVPHARLRGGLDSPGWPDAARVEIREQKAHKYAAIHIPEPFQNPFVSIPGAYKTLMEYMRVNGLEHAEQDVIPCFETDGDSMDVYIACV